MALTPCSSFPPLSPAPTSQLARRGYASHSHEEESFESFTSRYVSFFGGVQDLFELQRGLNNCFAYDLVPSPEVIEAALRASRRVNDYSTAVRIYEGVREKCENEKQYMQYVEALNPVKEELGQYSPTAPLLMGPAAPGEVGMLTHFPFLPPVHFALPPSSFRPARKQASASRRSSTAHEKRHRSHPLLCSSLHTHPRPGLSHSTI